MLVAAQDIFVKQQYFCIFADSLDLECLQDPSISKLVGIPRLLSRSIHYKVTSSGDWTYPCLDSFILDFPHIVHILFIGLIRISTTCQLNYF